MGSQKLTYARQIIKGTNSKKRARQLNEIE